MTRLGESSKRPWSGRALSLDPGKATGISEFHRDRVDTPSGSRVTDSHRAWCVPYHEALEYAEQQIAHGYADLVVCEDFVISSRTLKTGSDGWRRGAELEFIGVVRWLCSKHDVELVLRTPDLRKFATDEKLVRYGWWTKGLDHPREASRHLMTYLVERRVIDAADLVRPRS